MARRAERRTPLSRERILQAALALVDRHGLEALSMRRLGAELGVEAMSLYRHFQNKEALLDGLQEAVLGELEPVPTRSGWRTALARASHAYRKVLAAHTAVMPLFASRQLFSAGVMRHIEPSMAVLVEAGLSGAESVYAVEAITSYVVGHAMGQWGDPRTRDGGQFLSLQLRQLSELPAEQFPLVAALLPTLASHDFDKSFALGLDALLDGLEARLKSASPGAGPPRRARG